MRVHSLVSGIGLAFAGVALTASVQTLRAGTRSMESIVSDAPASNGAKPPSLFLHMAPAPLDPCELTGAELTCGAVDTRGARGARQAAYVVIAGASNVSEVRFGITYDDGVMVYGWTSCIQGVELASPTWPQPNSTIEVGWSHCVRALGADQLVVVGWLDIAPGSWGRIAITDLGRDRDASITGCDSSGAQVELPLPRLGSARVDGAGSAWCRCP